MNKKDLADIRKEFKLGSYMMPIKEVYSVYLKKDNGEIITRELNYFDMMDIEKKELYLNNFKKVLTGTIDTKIFELDFKMADLNQPQLDGAADIENVHVQDLYDSTQNILYKALSSGESITAYADAIVEKISKYYTYDSDVVINFVKAEYYKGNKKRNEEGEEAIDDYVQAIEFILCSVNKVDIPKKFMKFDYLEMAFKPNSALDTIINLNSPLDGFMFPSFSNGYVDVNKVIYYSSKSKQLNTTFVEDILGCSIKPTAVEEKESFNAILNNVIGDKIKPEIMQDIYEKINEKVEDSIEEDDEEEPTVDMREIKRILENSGVDNTETIQGAFELVCGGDYEFKAKNIVPDFNSKSIKIENETTSITIAPKDLANIKQIINKEGKRCLLIELNDDIQISGFKLETEDIESII